MLSEAYFKNTGTNIDIVEYYSFQIGRCINSKSLKLGMLLHSHLIKTSLHLNVFLANRLIDMYAKCGSTACAQFAFDDVLTKNDHSWNTLLSAYTRSGQLDRARSLFDEMPNPNLVSCNSMVSGLTHHGFHREALEVFGRMRKQYGYGIIMDKFTIVGVAGACASLADMDSLRQFHGVILLTGLELNQIMANTLIDAYGKCGDVDSSRLVFDQMLERDVISWTSLLGAYARASRLEEARWVFDKMPIRNAVSWTSLITGYAQNGHGDMAMELFKQMMEKQIDPTPFTLVSVLSACANLAFIEQGRQLHGFIIRRSTGSDKFNVFICNALIDMYAKCGIVATAMALFEKMPERDTVSWNSLLMGFAQNGHGKQALTTYDEMIRSGFKPNHITFLGLLSACSHAGLVSEGCRFLGLMETEHGIRPRPEHYAIFVDLLGRNCQVEKAMEMIEHMPFSEGLNNAGTWGALLSACKVHGNLNVGTKAAESILKLEPSNGARYVLLSNIYAAAGQWEDARHVRRLMKLKGLGKEPAHSWIEIRNARYGFVAEDKSHCQTEEIYQRLTRLTDHMKDSGYYPSNNDSLIFIPEEEEDVLSSSHRAVWHNVSN